MLTEFNDAATDRSKETLGENIDRNKFLDVIVPVGQPQTSHGLPTGRHRWRCERPLSAAKPTLDWPTIVDALEFHDSITVFPYPVIQVTHLFISPHHSTD